MTITAQTSKTGPYSGNGTTTVFSYTFEVQDEAHLVITLADAAGVETVQVLNTNYTVSGVGNAAGGQITMSTAPAVGYTLTISRNVPITQEVDLENRRSVAPEVLEDAYDKLTQIAQDLSEQVGRAIKVSVTESGNPTLSLQGDVQPNTFLGFDASGNLTQLSPASGTFISPNAAIVAVDDFTGDGTTVAFTLGGIPLSPNNLFIFLDGVMQDAANYTVSGTTLTFTTAPPLNTNIEVRRLQAVALAGGTTADLVTYTPAGNIAASTVQAAINELDTEKQPVDAGLTSISGLTTAADKMIYTTAPDTYATADLTSAGRALVAGANAAAQRATLGLVLGTDVQVYDADTAKTDVAQTFSAQQSLTGGLVLQVAAAAAIAAVGDAVNTTNKVQGKVVYDSTNNRLMVAAGAAAADPWYIADGSASVTPA